MHKLKEIKVIFEKNVYINMSYSYPTTIYESIFAQIYVFLAKRIIFAICSIKETSSCSIKETSSPKGNDCSPDNKSSKYFEQFSSKRFINWSRAANSAVHGWIRPNFKLIRDYIVVLGTCKNEEDPTSGKMKALEC